MPVVSRFFGIVISLNYRDHNPPHFHASYGDDDHLPLNQIPPLT